jgi:hypothetical protein
VTYGDDGGDGVVDDNNALNTLVSALKSDYFNGNAKGGMVASVLGKEGVELHGRYWYRWKAS